MEFGCEPGTQAVLLFIIVVSLLIAIAGQISIVFQMKDSEDERNNSEKRDAGGKYTL